MRFHRATSAVLVYVGVAIALLCTPRSYAELDRGLKVEVTNCNGVRCSTSEGLQAGLTMVELQGAFPRFGGSMLRVVVVPQGNPNQIELDIKAGTMADGKFRAGIAAYKLQAGDYQVAVFSPSKELLASGKLHVQRTANSEANHTEAPVDAAGLAGTWYGINGTSGVLELRADGKYSFQGQVMGSWTRSGNAVNFTGEPFAFAGNHAALRSGGVVLMFIKGSAALYFQKTS